MSKEQRKTENAQGPSSIEPGSVIGRTVQYTIRDQIGRGGFGFIFSAVTDQGLEVAVKVARDRNPEYQLYHRNTPESLLQSEESKALKKGENEEDKTMEMMAKVPAVYENELQTEYYVLMHVEHLEGFPHPYEFSVYGDETYLVMTRLGKSLSTLFEERNYTFSLPTILRITDQMLIRLEALHGMGIVHGDIKPDNILLGVGADAGTLHLIDFGLSTMYKNLKTDQHLCLRVNKHSRGTPRFMSIHAHNKVQQSRRDDMEGLGYVLAYFTSHGALPWKEVELLKCNSKMLEKILSIKEEIMAEQLFLGQPREFSIFMEFAWQMNYTAQPDYAGFRKMFRRLGAILDVDYSNDKFI